MPDGSSCRRRARADELGLIRRREQRLRVHRCGARLDVDVRDHVLRRRLARPEELARVGVERIDDAGLARDARDHALRLALMQARVDPLHRLRIGRERGVDDQPLERMIEVPAVDDVLEVPNHLARAHVERERRVVVEVLVVVAREHELRRGCGDRRADVDPFRRRVVARHHPHADVPALLVGDVAPGLVAGLAGLRDRADAARSPCRSSRRTP